MPGALSVTGFDDLAEASWTSPGLTTVRQSIDTKGRLAAEYLVKTIARGGPAEVHHQRLPMSLLVRSSTGPVGG